MLNGVSREFTEHVADRVLFLRLGVKKWNQIGDRRRKLVRGPNLGQWNEAPGGFMRLNLFAWIDPQKSKEAHADQIPKCRMGLCPTIHDSIAVAHDSGGARRHRENRRMHRYPTAVHRELKAVGLIRGPAPQEPLNV